MPSEFDHVLHEIGVSQGIFSEAQAEAAFHKIQDLEARGQVYPLSIVLERLNLITETDRLALENAARYRIHRDADKEIARIIKDNGYVLVEAVDEALGRQKEHYRQTGETIRISFFLIEQGTMNEAQRIAADKLYELGAAQNEDLF